MSWDELDKVFQTHKEKSKVEFQEALKKAVILTDKQIVEIAPKYMAHFAQESAKPKKDRRIFYNEMHGGFIVAIQFPAQAEMETLISNKVAAAYKRTKDNAWYWYGPKLFLIDAISTVFMPEEWEVDKNFGWMKENSKHWLFIFNANVSRDFKWLDDPDNTYGRVEWKFIKEARDRFNDNSINTIDDIDQTEIDSRIKYTVNILQLLTVRKGVK